MDKNTGLLAHSYWYPDDITQEEAECELKDLAEHYENIVILVPPPEHLNFHTLNLAKESESEVSACTIIKHIH